MIWRLNASLETLKSKEVKMKSVLIFLTGVFGLVACGDVARIGVVILDEVSNQPVVGAKVHCRFDNWSDPACHNKNARRPVIKYEVTDAKGACAFSGSTDNGRVGVSVAEPPAGYYRRARGNVEEFADQNVVGVWQPENVVVTQWLQRVGHPVPLFVKRISNDAKDLFAAAGGPARYDLMMGEWLPPLGTGTVADIEFERLPRESLGRGEHDGITGEAFRVAMMVRFPGEGNGLVAMSYSDWWRLKIRTAPEDGYASEFKCWTMRGKDLKWSGTFDTEHCYCFRIRTRRDDAGKIVSANYGKIYGDIKMVPMSDKGSQPVSVEMLYYLNTTPLDRNLEYGRVNLYSAEDRPNELDLRP